jgi:hypothetical protein
MNVDDELLDKAIDRIARTSDGAMLYLFLQKALSAVPLDTSGYALPQNHGRRSFASELMAKMAAGIRDAHGGRDPTDSPITFAVREPVKLAGRESARSFLSRTDPELASLATGPGGGRSA